MSRLADILRSAERIDRQVQEIRDLNDRAHATDTHIRDQYDAALAEALRRAGRR